MSASSALQARSRGDLLRTSALLATDVQLGVLLLRSVLLAATSLQRTREPVWHVLLVTSASPETPPTLTTCALLVTSALSARPQHSRIPARLATSLQSLEPRRACPAIQAPTAPPPASPPSLVSVQPATTVSEPAPPPSPSSPSLARQVPRWVVAARRDTTVLLVLSIHFLVLQGRPALLRVSLLQTVSAKLATTVALRPPLHSQLTTACLVTVATAVGLASTVPPAVRGPCLVLLAPTTLTTRPRAALLALLVQLVHTVPRLVSLLPPASVQLGTSALLVQALHVQSRAFVLLARLVQQALRLLSPVQQEHTSPSKAKPPARAALQATGATRRPLTSAVLTTTVLQDPQPQCSVQAAPGPRTRQPHSPSTSATPAQPVRTASRTPPRTPLTCRLARVEGTALLEPHRPLVRVSALSACCVLKVVQQASHVHLARLALRQVSPQPLVTVTPDTTALEELPLLVQLMR